MSNCGCNGSANLLGTCPHGHFQTVAVEDGWHSFGKPVCCSLCPAGVAEKLKLQPAAQVEKDRSLAHSPYPIRGDTFIPPKCPVNKCVNSVAYWTPRGDERPMVSDRCSTHERTR